MAGECFRISVQEASACEAREKCIGAYLLPLAYRHMATCRRIVDNVKLHHLLRWTRDRHVWS